MKAEREKESKGKMEPIFQYFNPSKGLKASFMSPSFIFNN